ncbi:MAG: hypothetical protein ACRECX_12165 [Methyloceanibacter sp.]|uniref:hypothetical protein n=1 Tax=Methyloceanibacter sp. TaxID=1965321 RepID=UPI003D6CA933
MRVAAQARAQLQLVLGEHPASQRVVTVLAGAAVVALGLGPRRCAPVHLGELPGPHAHDGALAVVGDGGSGQVGRDLKPEDGELGPLGQQLLSLVVARGGEPAVDVGGAPVNGGDLGGDGLPPLAVGGAPRALRPDARRVKNPPPSLNVWVAIRALLPAISLRSRPR